MRARRCIRISLGPTSSRSTGSGGSRWRDRPDQVLDADLVGATAEWSEVEVPGCWTMQGFDSPQYTNVQMPFAGPPPNVPDANPTGVYRRAVTVPATWRDKRIVLHVAGAESVLYVHADGVPVGMGKDSRLPHEFDLTGLAVPGGTFELALTVVRWSDATYLEDQDHWFHAGLHRSVFLYATPPVFIADLHVIADYDPETGDGRLDVRIDVDTIAAAPKGWRARVTVAGEQAEAAVYFEHHNWVVNFLRFEGRGAERVADRARRRALERGDAEPPRPHGHAARRRAATKSMRRRSPSDFGGWRCVAPSCS